MFDIQNYTSFIMAILVFQALPGAGTVTILNATAKNGVVAGMCAVFGTLTGDWVYMCAAVLGLAASLSAYPGTLKGLQWLGAAYLCLIGLMQLLKAENIRSANVAAVRRNVEYYRQALVVSLTNPKVILFFMAFFPLFLREGYRTVTLVLQMVHVTAISFIFQMGLVFVGNVIARWFSQWQSARQVAKFLVGAAFISFGINLAFNIN